MIVTAALLTLLATPPSPAIPVLHGGDPRCTDCVWQSSSGVGGQVSDGSGLRSHPLRLRLVFTWSLHKAMVYDLPVDLDANGELFVPIELPPRVRVLSAVLTVDSDARLLDDGTLDQDPATAEEVDVEDAATQSDFPSHEYDFQPNAAATQSDFPSHEYDFQPNAIGSDAVRPAKPLPLCVWNTTGDCIKAGS